MFTDIRIDHDIPHSEYDISHILRWSKKIPYPVRSIFIRSSCGGNTHVLVTVKGDLSPLDTLLIRAIMRDDTRRLRGDLERYATNSKVFGLLFDEKIDVETGERFNAGEWVKVC